MRNRVPAKPLHTKSILGAPVRYYPSPDGKGLPWISVTDLAIVLNISNTECDARDLFIHALEICGHCVAIPTSTGPVLLVSHPLACSLIDAFPCDAKAKDRLTKAYELGGAEALRVLYAHLPLPKRVMATIAAHHHTWSSGASELLRGRSYH